MTALDELYEVRELLLRMVNQHCRDGLDPKRDRLFSGFIGVNAEVMRYLGEVGLLNVTSDNGGRVVEVEPLKEKIRE
jgi:hypothetical protein